MNAVAYGHHSGGLGAMLAHLVLRGAVYRVLWDLPLPVVLVAAGLALLVLWHRRRSS